MLPSAGDGDTAYASRDCNVESQGWRVGTDRRTHSCCCAFYLYPRQADQITRRSLGSSPSIHRQQGAAAPTIIRLTTAF